MQQEPVQITKRKKNNFISYLIIIMETNNNDRTRCLIYTRCMWYLAPTYRYNIWKRSEFYSRKTFSKKKAAEHKFNNVIENNKSFIEQYWNS